MSCMMPRGDCSDVAGRSQPGVTGFTIHLVQYRVLGEVDVVVDGEVRQIGSPNQRLVLSALLAHPNAVVTTNALVAALWDDEPPASAASTLRTYVSRLRRLIGANLAADAAGYRLSVDTSDVDATLFEQRLDAAASASPADALGLFDAALATWRGPAFGDHADNSLILGAASRLEELRVSALEQRVAVLLASGSASKAVADATALVADHPHREGVWITLIDALVAVDRSADATRAAARARAALAEAGLEPGPGLRHAEARALGIDRPSSTAVTTTPNEAGSSQPGTRSVDGPAGTPIMRSGRPSSFVGRERQLEELAGLIVAAPVVTLVGPGGVGKTRLAIELAAMVAPRHRLGARMIELGTLTDPDEVAAVVASGLGLTIDRTSIEQALVSAGDLDMVAVIDNAEHVAAAAARVVELLASGGGSIRVVVTSRERLAVDGEHVRAVRPLAADASSSPAQTLLRDRAMAAGAALDDHDDEAITRAVQRLDGLPLAIEMAAAQLTSCSLTELLANLDERLDELNTPSTRVPPRHQSLGALIDWSLDELDHTEATLLHHLTVFAGSFGADDVARVLGADSVTATRRLADRSLVAAVVASSRTSFRVLHVMRERIHHRLGPVDEDVRAAHAHWYLNKARSAVAEMMSSYERSGRDTLNEILDELRAVHRWSSERDRPLALALSATIHPFAHSSLNDEVLSWADRLLPHRPGDDRDDAAIVIASSATRLLRHGQLADSAELARQAIALAEHAEARLAALETLADATLDEGLLDDSEVAFETLLDEGSRAGNAWYASSGATGVLLVAAYSGRTPARPIDPATFGGDAPLSARAWLAYGHAELLAATDPVRAEALYRDALSLARSAANRYIEGVSLASLAALQGKTGQSAALATFRAAIQHWLDAADHTHQITTLRNLATLFRALDLPIGTARLLGGLNARHVATYGSELADLATIEQWLVDTLSPAALAATLADGDRLSMAELARRALATIDEHITYPQGTENSDPGGRRSDTGLSGTDDE
jgi:predicted ATPase/DNA-binding SARP family transcriptional activator